MKRTKQVPKYKRDFVYMKDPNGKVVKVGASQEELTHAMVSGLRQVPPPAQEKV